LHAAPKELIDMYISYKQ